MSKPAMAPKITGWTPEQDRDFLLTVISENPPKKGEWDLLSRKFNEGFGYEKTAEACR